MTEGECETKSKSCKKDIFYYLRTLLPAPSALPNKSPSGVCGACAFPHRRRAWKETPLLCGGSNSCGKSKTVRGRGTKWERHLAALPPIGKRASGRDRARSRKRLLRVLREAPIGAKFLGGRYIDTSCTHSQRLSPRG